MLMHLVSRGGGPSLLTLLGLVVACGSGDDGATDGSNAAGKQNGNAGSGAGAGAPSAGNGGAGTSGGRAPGGTGGTPGGGKMGAAESSSAGAPVGGAGGSNAMDALDPSLPVPSYDCRTDTQTKQCVSVSGTLGGQPIDRHCASAMSPRTLFRNPDAWPIACIEGSSSTSGYWYQVNVPIQGPGSFSYTITPDTEYAADVGIALDDRGSDVRADHLVGATVMGTVTVDPDTTNDIVVGTFRATWTEPAANCRPRLPRQCVAAQIHGTFRVVNRLKIEDFP